MKPLILFLLLSTAAWGQDSMTTKIFRDVYGNWYNSAGAVETNLVENKPKTADNVWRVFAEDSSYTYEYRIVKKPPTFRIITNTTEYGFTVEDGFSTGSYVRQRSTGGKKTVLAPGSYDIVINGFVSYERTKNKEDRVFLFYAGEKVLLKSHYRMGRIYALINGKYIAL